MGALVTVVPSFVDTSKFSRATFDVDQGFGTAGSDFGPWPVGSFLYAVLQDNTAFQPHVYKFTVTGTSSVQAIQDVAHEPPTFPEYLISVFDPVNKLIYISYGDGIDSNPIVVVFDCNTNTYGTYGPTGVDSFQGVQAGLLSTGVFRFFFIDGTAHAAFTVDYSGGTWGTSSTAVATGHLTSIGLVKVDASDRSHVLIFVLVGGGVVQPQYFNVDSGGTVSGVTNLLTVDATLGQNTGLPQIYGGTLFIPITSDDKKTLKVLTGTPLSGPIFTSTAIVSESDPSVVLEYPTIFLNRDGFPTLFWVVLDQATEDPDEMWMSTYDGASWGAPVLFYDELANPPVGAISPGTGQFLHTIGAYQLPSREWIVVTAIETREGVEHCTGLVLLSGGGVSLIDFVLPDFVKRPMAPGN